MPPRGTKRTAAKPSPASKKLKENPRASDKHEHEPAHQPVASTSQRPPAREASSRARQPRDSDSSDDQDEDEDEDEDDEDGFDAVRSAPIVTASSGDAYLIHSGTASKTSSTLLSSSIDPAFTLRSYTAALATFDSLQHPAFIAVRQAVEDEEADAREVMYPKWVLELQSGFNVVLWGFGSKRSVVNGFAEWVRTRGEVVVVDGFDVGVGVGDVVAALEGVVRVHQQKEDKRRTKKGRAGGTAAAGAGAVSPLEGRVRRICQALATGKGKDVYLIVHNLDGPALRAPKTMSLLALLAAHPKFHLLATVDHVRSGLILPQALTNARPPPPLSLDDNTSLKTAETRAFTFVYHHVSTLAPYTYELSRSTLLSSLLPPTIFPRSSHLASSHGSSIQSAVYVLKTVGLKRQALFVLLASLQLSNYETLPPAAQRGIDLDPASTAPAPKVSVRFNSLDKQAASDFISNDVAQTWSMLNEFVDHGLVKKSVVAPEEDDAGEQEDDGGERAWVWITLEKSELEELVEKEEWKD
ncbi:origin recognition complex subunit 2 [Pseudohyphozyma bogoriensis]|nr:origin recognition complex subunit 2 [Pseudohyphozyma bogoriensis]